MAAAPSSLNGALALAPSQAGSSATPSIIGAVAGCAAACSVAACPTVVCPTVASSVGPEPKMVLGSTSEAALQNSSQALPHWNSNFMKNEAIFSFDLQVGAPV